MVTMEDLRRPGATEQQAIDASFKCAKALRENGALAEHLGAQREMYVDLRFRTSLLLPFMKAGFEAGYTGKPKPTIEQVKASR